MLLHALHCPCRPPEWQGPKQRVVLARRTPGAILGDDALRVRERLDLLDAPCLPYMADPSLEYGTCTLLGLAGVTHVGRCMCSLALPMRFCWTLPAIALFAVSHTRETACYCSCNHSQERRLAVSVVAASPRTIVLAVSSQRFSMCVDALTLRLFNKVRSCVQWCRRPCTGRIVAASQMGVRVHGGPCNVIPNADARA
jgi:hypothetical protein